MKATKFFIVLLSLCIPVAAQTGGQFVITQSVIAGGGAASDDGPGGQFTLTGTIGQSVAGVRSFGSIYRIQSGFWRSDLAPTSASISIIGRVVSELDQPVNRASVRITNLRGVSRSAITNTFGYFMFEEIPVGESYVVEYSARGFLSGSQVIVPMEDISDLKIIMFHNAEF
ncbi:carboxypeptidase-like regulatory domain-containing protein [Leptolyngbya sp. 7M]|uniref:carboxypeptidase-like regulatory domain-containing protein n=1 Tax=Leptolyngbya sp. 7M TaxID=2812896 RepID=UPI001B8BBB27|nr:carboxypeptidase-like regulatory domain-containing protein [Leptolyngbya sp. 7M]QYO65850.1 carboxypeptidase-like regulatory domain-containing protein [Leptolyngbya sp. 7M]QYU67957.1 carboxypeptidase-like regulatory domain-containing protein [Leptolyngbya sp. 15MV]